MSFKAVYDKIPTCNNRSYCISAPTKELTDYGKETTLHGLKYVFQGDKHLCEKVFWTTAFVSGIMAAGFLIYEVCVSYMKNPVVVTYQVAETHISSIPFPAITAPGCNTNRVMKSSVNHLLQLANISANDFLSTEPGSAESNRTLLANLKQLQCVDYICKESSMFADLENDSDNNSIYEIFLSQFEKDFGFSSSELEIFDKDIEAARHIVRHPCDEYALYCKWNNLQYNCSELFSFMNTIEGQCCVFNKIPAVSIHADLDNMYENAEKERSWGEKISSWNPLYDDESEEKILLKNIKQIRTQKNRGRPFGLTVVLNPKLEEHYCSVFNEQGFVFKTHLPFNEPDINESSHPIPPGTEVFASISPLAIFADKDIREFQIENRKCYFKDEYGLRLHKTYTAENCIIECEVEAVEEMCGCTLFYLNLSGNESCDDEDCYLSALDRFYSRPLSEKCPHCLPTCNQLEYIENIVSSPISKMNSKYYTGISREFYKSWLNKNASILHVYFENDSFYAQERKQLYTLSELIGNSQQEYLITDNRAIKEVYIKRVANIEGLLGLCLGFSGLSLVELGYFFFIRPCFNRKRAIGPILNSSANQDSNA